MRSDRWLHNLRFGSHRNYRSGFTLIEMMITVAILGIAAAVIMPSLSTEDQMYVDAGVSLMVGDLDFAQTMAISDPSDTSIVKFNVVDSQWWVAPSVTPDTPYTKLYSEETYDTTLGEGRAYLSEGVTFAVSNVTDGCITYNAFGQLDQETNPQITFSLGDASAVITIDSETGFLSVN